MTRALAIHRRHARLCNKRSGLSLLETILAIAILGMAIAIVGEFVRVGTIAAASARDTTMAQLLCEGKLAELTSGLQPLTSANNTPVEVAPDWQYSVQVQNSSQSGLLMIGVTVTNASTQTARPVSVTLYRWMIDPQVTAQIEAAAEAAEAAKAQESQNSSSSTSNTSGSGNGAGSGSGGGTGGTNNGPR